MVGHGRTPYASAGLGSRFRDGPISKRSTFLFQQFISTWRSWLLLLFTFHILRRPSGGQRRVSALGRFLHSQQRARPDSFVFAHPSLVDHPNRHSIERINSLPSLLACDDERRLPQYIEVL